MKSKVLLFVSAFAALAHADPFPRVTIASSAGQTMTSGKIYSVEGNITITAPDGQPALAVAPGAKAILEVVKSKTLTVKGGNGTSSACSYPAILVPESSTLYIVGEGTLDLTGGDAGNGASGAKGADGKNPETTHAQAGNGGTGGNGGAGGSPAIGGSGGKGGSGSAGALGQYNKDFYPCFDGNSATTPGSDGANGSTMGNVIIVGGVVVKASKGNSGGGGAGGKSGSKHDAHNWSSGYNLTVCGGGGGGGGGGGYAAQYDIGGGAGGGGGGGGGGSGGAATSGSGSPFAAGGSGGSGATSGNHGDKSAKETAKGTKFGDKTGGDGASGGNAGSSGAHGTLKLLAPAALTANREAELLTPSTNPDEFFSVTVTFDWGIASMPESTVQACFMAAPPMGPAKTRKGYRFLGWWTAPDGGECYYVPDSEGQACRPLSTVSSLTRDIRLYPRWVPTPEILTVNSTRDSRFDPTKKEQAQSLDEVTLLDALDAFKAYPYLTGTDGYRRITFNLPEEDRVLTISSPITLDQDIEFDGTNQGRGIIIKAGADFPQNNSSCLVMQTNCKAMITNLTLDGAGKAGCISCERGLTELINCAIVNGGELASAAIQMTDGEFIALNSSLTLNKCIDATLRAARSPLTLVNCTFADNRNNWSSVMFEYKADAVFANCTFVGSSARHLHSFGGMAFEKIHAVNTLFSDGAITCPISRDYCLVGDGYFRDVNERVTNEVFGVAHRVAPAAFCQESLTAVEVLTDRKFENLGFRSRTDATKIFTLRGSTLNASVPLLIDEVRDLYLTPNVGAVRLLVGDRMPTQIMEGEVSGTWPGHYMDVNIRYDDGSEQLVQARLLGQNLTGMPIEVPLNPPESETRKPVALQPMFISSADKLKRLGDSPYAFVAASAKALYKANEGTVLDGEEFAAASAVTQGGIIADNELNIEADTYTAGTVDGFGEITLESIDVTTGALAWIGEPAILNGEDDTRSVTVIAPSDGLLQIEGEHFVSEQTITVSLGSLVITPEGTVTSAKPGHVVIENPIWTIPVAKGDSIKVTYGTTKPKLQFRHYPFGLKGNN